MELLLLGCAATSCLSSLRKTQKVNVRSSINFTGSQGDTHVLYLVGWSCRTNVTVRAGSRA
jgi:hypothetical protein